MGSKIIVCVNINIKFYMFCYAKMSAVFYGLYGVESFICLAVNQLCKTQAVCKCTSVSNWPVKNDYGRYDPLKLNLCVLLDNALQVRVLFE